MLTPRLRPAGTHQHRVANGGGGPGLETMSWPRAEVTPQGTKSWAEPEVEAIHLALEFSASDRAEAASLVVSPKGTCAF